MNIFFKFVHAVPVILAEKERKESGEGWREGGRHKWMEEGGGKEGGGRDD